MLLHKGFHPIYRRRRSQTVSIQILDPCKEGSYPKNFDQSEKHYINRYFPAISVIIVLKSEEMPVTKSKRPDGPLRQLSSSSTISDAILEICINGTDLPLPTSIESNQRHQRGFYPLRSPASLCMQSKRPSSWLLLQQTST